MIREHLARHGIKAFLDLIEPAAGRWRPRLMREIENAQCFLVILSKGCLERCSDQDDVFREEIVHALKTGRKIVPVELKRFRAPLSLPEELRVVWEWQSLKFDENTYDEDMRRVLDFVKSKLSR